jgi:hypothetical protein
MFAGLKITLNNGQQLDLYSDYHAVIIGNSDYEYFPKLRGVEQDVADLKSMFEGFGIGVTLLQNLTGDQMLDALNDIVDVQGKDPNRALIVYFAGHGFTEKRADGTDLGYIVPIDAPYYDKNPGAFRNKAVSMTKINEIAELVSSKHVLMMFDSCFSGTLFSVRRAVPQIIDEKTSLPVRQFITAGSANEAVPDHSIFKATLVKGLGEGFADLNSDGFVTGEELGSYLENNVVNYTKGMQHPKYGKINNLNLDRGDFVFVLKQTAARPVALPLASPSTRLLSLSANVAGASYLLQDSSSGKEIKANGNSLLDVPYGSYKLNVEKWGYYTSSTPLEISSGAEQINHETTLEPLPPRFLNSFKNWRTNKYGSLAVLAITAGITALTYSKADTAYDKYLAADNPEDALSRRSKFEDARDVYNISLGVNLLPLAGFFYANFRSAQTAQQIHTEMQARLEK